MKRTLASLVLVTGFVISAFTSNAQMGSSPGMKPEVSAAMLKIFGKRDFTAKADTKMAQGDTKIEMPMHMSVLEGKMRSEMDMTAVKGLPEAAAAGMIQMGMDKMVSISRPDLQK